MTKEQLANLEEQLRTALLRTGLSHHELARRSGVSQPVLSRFISGERSLSLPIASKLCQMLGLRLCGDEEAAHVGALQDGGKAEPETSAKQGRKKGNGKK